MIQDMLMSARAESTKTFLAIFIYTWLREPIAERFFFERVYLYTKARET